MTRVLLDPHQYDDALDDLIDLISGVEADPKNGRPQAQPGARKVHAELYSLIAAAQPDGFPRGKGFDGGARSTEYDEELDPVTGEVRNIPLPPRSDSTANAVAQRSEQTEAKLAYAALVNTVNDVRRQLSIAISKALKALPPLPTIVDADELWCTSCLRLQISSPRQDGKGRGDLCGWCYGWKLARHDGFELPPVEILEHHHRYNRVSERFVNETLARLRREAASTARSGKGGKAKRSRASA